MDDIEILVQDLRRMAAQTGHLSAACLGCGGYEHSCSVHGCGLIHKAADQLEELDRFTGSQIERLLLRISKLEKELRASETARADLAKRLTSAQRALHDVKSDLQAEK